MESTPSKLPDVYKAPGLWRHVYHSEKNGVLAVTQKSAILMDSKQNSTVSIQLVCFLTKLMQNEYNIDIFRNIPVLPAGENEERFRQTPKLWYKINGDFSLVFLLCTIKSLSFCWIHFTSRIMTIFVVGYF